MVNRGYVNCNIINKITSTARADLLIVFDFPELQKVLKCRV